MDYVYDLQIGTCMGGMEKTPCPGLETLPGRTMARKYPARSAGIRNGHPGEAYYAVFLCVLEHPYSVGPNAGFKC